MKANVIFEVRNDKLLGILVLTIQCADIKVPHFFREFATLPGLDDSVNRDHTPFELLGNETIFKTF